jgi:hypothetical protein
MLISLSMRRLDINTRLAIPLLSKVFISNLDMKNNGAENANDKRSTNNTNISKDT